MSKRELLKKIGNISQLCNIKQYRMEDGKKDGFRAVDVRNGNGLDFTVFLDRAMDIFEMSYKGMNITYQSPSGIISPEYFHNNKNGFVESWHAGLFSTCGLICAGIPCTDGTEELPLHGYIDNIPAEQVYAGMDWEDGTPVMRVTGKMINAKEGGENLVLTREIICKYKENKVYINDSVENNGFSELPLMLIYHFNFGYPLLDANSYAYIPAISSEARGSTPDLSNYMHFDEPKASYSEESFYHTPKADINGDVAAAIINPDKDIGVAVKFNVNQLKVLIQVKQLQDGNYLTTLEPANVGVEGRAKEREVGRLEYIKPGEIRKFNLEIMILDGQEEIQEFKKQWH